MYIVIKLCLHLDSSNHDRDVSSSSSTHTLLINSPQDLGTILYCSMSLPFLFYLFSTSSSIGSWILNTTILHSRPINIPPQINNNKRTQPNPVLWASHLSPYTLYFSSPLHLILLITLVNLQTELFSRAFFDVWIICEDITFVHAEVIFLKLKHPVAQAPARTKIKNDTHLQIQSPSPLVSFR